MNANSAVAAAVNIGHAPAASAGPVAAGTHNVKRSDAELFASFAGSARELASVDTMKAKAAGEEGKAIPLLMLPKVTKFQMLRKSYVKWWKSSLRRQLTPSRQRIKTSFRSPGAPDPGA